MFRSRSAILSNINLLTFPSSLRMTSSSSVSPHGATPPTFRALSPADLGRAYATEFARHVQRRLTRSVCP